MTIVGIIANPASGKDIRRLIAHGSVFDNQEKVNIVRRVMLGLQAAGVDEVVYMPDYFGIGRRAEEGIQLSLKTSSLEMPVQATQDDSSRAAKMMRDIGAGAIITLGGDGTNRAVAKTVGEVPIMPISTGTNNVFPQMVEGTVAGLAAGIVATGRLPLSETTERQLRLDIYRDGELIDIALVDVVVYSDIFVGARAVWDMSKVSDIILTRASPSNIGLSSIGGGLYCAHRNHSHGVHIRLAEGSGPIELTAPIAPGLVQAIHLESYKLLEVGASIPISASPTVLALDGEREVSIHKSDQVQVFLTDHGPWLINMQRTLDLAAQQGLLANVPVPAVSQGACLLHAIGLCKDPPTSCLPENSLE